MDISEIQALISSKVPVAEFLGIQVEAVEPGHIKLQLPFSARVQNHLEIVYAGAIFALAEIAGGMAMLSVFDAAPIYNSCGTFEYRFSASFTAGIVV